MDVPDVVRRRPIRVFTHAAGPLRSAIRRARRRTATRNGRPRAYRPALHFSICSGLMKLTAIAFAAALVTLAAPQTQAAATPAPSTTGTADNPPALWNLTSLYADDAAWDAARQKVLAQLPRLKALQGTLGTSAASLLHAMQTSPTCRALEPRRGLRQPEGRRRHAGHRQRGAAPAGGRGTLAVLAGHGLGGARGRGHRPGQDRRLHRRRAQARAACLRAAQDAAPGRAHAARQRGDAAGRRRRPVVAAGGDLRPAGQRRPAVAHDHRARQEGDAGPGDLRQAARGRRPEGARPGLPRVLPRLQGVPAHDRRDLRGASEGRRVRRARAQVRDVPAGQAGRGQHARRRLPHAGRRGQRRPAHAAALPEAARPPAGPEGAEVLRHLRRAREGAAHLHAGRGRGADAQGRRAAGRGLRQGARPALPGRLDGRRAAQGQALGRLHERRPRTTCIRSCC